MFSEIYPINSASLNAWQKSAKYCANESLMPSYYAGLTKSLDALMNFKNID